MVVVDTGLMANVRWDGSQQDKVNHFGQKNEPPRVFSFGSRRPGGDRKVIQFLRDAQDQ